MGTALIGEAAYLLVLTIGIGCLQVRIAASVALGIAAWAISHQAGMALALACISFLLTEGILRGLTSLSTHLRTVASVVVQVIATVAVGNALIRDSPAKGFLIGTPYPALFLISSFWIPLLFSPTGTTTTNSEMASCDPGRPALPLVITSITTFITMMLQGYALLPFGALAGLLSEEELSVVAARQHALILICSVVLGVIANELSYRLSL